MPGGATVGALAATHLADKLGRKKTIILAGVLWVVGSILQCASIVSVSSSRQQHPSLISTILLNLEPRHACHWTNCLWYLYRADQLRHPHISVRNRASSYSRTYHLVDAVVDYLGNHGPIFRSVWLLVYLRRGVFPYTMGYPNDSGHCAQRRNVILP